MASDNFHIPWKSKGVWSEYLVYNFFYKNKLFISDKIANFFNIRDDIPDMLSSLYKLMKEITFK